VSQARSKIWIDLGFFDLKKGNGLQAMHFRITCKPASPVPHNPYPGIDIVSIGKNVVSLNNLLFLISKSP
jgi:hypothetical protein